VRTCATSCPRIESEREDMRLWPADRVAPVPVKGVKEARLLDGGPPMTGSPERDMSIANEAWLVRLFSDCNLITPRLI